MQIKIRGKQQIMEVREMDKQEIMVQDPLWEWGSGIDSKDKS